MKKFACALAISVPVSLVALAAWAQESAAPQVKQVRTATGPVTVSWGQPAESPNVAKHRAQIAARDANGDGRLNRNELPDGDELKDKFKLVDQNHDGGLSAEELANWH
ncbi:MAG: hypothetical protein ABWX88_04255 [Pseudoxanthomonas sp.]